MPRYRTRPINPFLQRLMDINGFESLKEINMESQGEIQISSLTKIADIDSTNRVLEFHLRLAEFFGVSMDTWVRGVMGKLSAEELERLPVKLRRVS